MYDVHNVAHVANSLYITVAQWIFFDTGTSKDEIKCTESNMSNMLKYFFLKTAISLRILKQVD